MRHHQWFKIEQAYLLWLLCPRVALAEDDANRERVRVVYDVPAGCPSQSFFEGRVQSRVQGPWLAPPNEGARLLRVSVSQHGGATWRASLDFDDAEGQTVSRTVNATTCDEAVSVMALVTALALESQVWNRRAVASIPTTTSDVTASETNPPSSDPQDLNPPQALHYELALGYQRAYGIGAHVANGVVFYAGLSPNGSVSWLRVYIEAFDSGTDTTELPQVKARVRAYAARFESCPLMGRLAPAWSVPLCGGFEAGLLTVTGSGEAPQLTRGRSDQVPWAAVYASPRIRWAIGPLYLESGPELRFLLAQRRYAVNYSGKLETAFETSLVAVGLSLAAGLHF